LWRTKDQQAAAAFEQKQYERAAELFENPDWKAAAQYKADLQEDGKMKTPKTATGFYNQGNVLANSKRLEEAIKAYDKALEMKPDFEYAKDNKKLVEEALKQQEQQQQQNQQQKDQKQDSEKEQQKKPQDQSASEQKPEQKDEKAEAKNGDKAQEKPETGAEKAPEKAEEPPKQSEEQQAKDGAAAKEDPKKPDPAKQNEASAQPIPPSDETKQANEQWLNRIPDDPAGLLKRKFKYQYGQRKQRSGNKAQNW